MKDQNKQMNYKIVELNGKIKFLEEEIDRILNKTPTPPPTPPPPPEPGKKFGVIRALEGPQW